MKKSLLCLALFGVAGVASAEPATYSIDPQHTMVYFEVPHFDTSTIRGRFNVPEGSVTFDREAQTGSAEITIDVASVSSGVDDFDGHLRDEFLNTDEHPEASFVSENFVFDGENVSAIEGKFTLNGQTHPVTLNAERFNCYDSPMVEREVCGGDFETTIARGDWGVDAMLPMAADVRLLIQIEAIRDE